MSPPTTSPKPDRAVIVGAKRTPFVRAGGDAETLDVLDLARGPAVELLASLGIDPASVDAATLGNVSRPVKYHNLARELVLAAGLNPQTPAHTVSLACASSCQAFTNGVDMIERGYADVVLTGGVESLSNVPIQYSPRLARTLVRASRAKTALAKLQTLATIRPRDLAPVAPAINGTSTGLTMGESAELMAKLNGITRDEQDEFALGSHLKAAKAVESRSKDLAPLYVFNGRARAVTADNHIRADSSREKLSALPPVFDRRYGSVTAGNSSPLTDGAAAVMLMSASAARQARLKPRAAVRAYAYAAVDPRRTAPAWTRLCHSTRTGPGRNKAVERRRI